MAADRECGKKKGNVQQEQIFFFNKNALFCKIFSIAFPVDK